MTLSNDYNGNLYVHYSATDTVEIVASMVYNSENAGTAGGSTVGQYLQEIAFNDGAVENLTGGLDLTATSTYHNIYGTAVGGDTPDGSQITGAGLFGTTGTETFIAGPDSTINAGIGTNIYVINADSYPASSGGATINLNTYATGVTAVAQASGLSRGTVLRGLAELRMAPKPSRGQRIRRKGAVESAPLTGMRR